MPGSGSLGGTVVDSNHNPLSRAQVHLDRDGTSGGCDLATEPDGRFLFANLPSGAFRLRVSFPGMQTVVDEQIVLQNGEDLTLPDLIVRLATTTQQVTVTVSQTELAQEEVKAQEKQRALVIFPNFYSSFIWNAAPLNSRQKFDLALHSIFDPVNFLVVGAEAGGLQYNDTYHYGSGAEAYAKYYGSTFADTATTRILGGAVLPSLLHQDPRYFYKGRGSVTSRSLYAITRAVITRSDAGRNEPNYSSIAGGLMAGAISNAYHPESDRGAGLTFRNGAIAIGGHAFDNLVREFILRPITSHVPESGVGQPPPK
jgi:carboxypeptidase family protein